MYPVSGSVTFQGKPLAEGQIAFRPDYERGGKGQLCVAEIVDGKFRGEATEGPKLIEIYGSWEIPGKFVIARDGSETKYPAMASVPAKYSEKSKLTANIEASENTGLDFALE